MITQANRHRHETEVSTRALSPAVRPSPPVPRQASARRGDRTVRSDPSAGAPGAVEVAKQAIMLVHFPLSDQPVHRFDRFRLDLHRGALFGPDGHEIPLRPKAFALLCWLVENRGRLVSRDEVLAAIWPGIAVTDDSIDQCVRDVRRALGADGRRLLRTLPRRGFLFSADGDRPEPERPAWLPAGAASAHPLPVADPGVDAGAVEQRRLPPHGPSGERRYMTSLSCELVSPAASGRPTDQDADGLVDAFRRTVQAISAQYGGVVGSGRETEVQVHFGLAQAGENDAEHAVRAALEIVSALQTHPLAQQRNRGCRIGIATGLVIVDESAASGTAELAIMGETPALAAGLRAAVPAGSVVVARGTRLLLGNLFAYRALGTLAIQGVEMPAWQVTGAGEAESRFEAFHVEGYGPLVGREEELSLLSRRWQQARQGEGRAVLLSGEPGIGKSRLVSALRRSLADEPHAVETWSCSPQHARSALLPVTEALRRAAGFAHDDPADALIDKFEQLFGPFHPPQEEMALLAELLDLAWPGGRPRDMAPAPKRQAIFRALLRRLAGMARRAPLLIVLEDAHWIDPTSREWLAFLIERIATLPILLLVTFRPEFEPGGADLPHVTRLALNRLNDSEGNALIASQPGAEGLPSAVTAAILARTDGVPLFVEELTRAVLEAGADARLTPDAAAPIEVPPTLQASLLARIDRLGADARIVAQYGAAIGREFPHDLLAAVVPMPQPALAEALARLVGAQLVLRRGIAPDLSYQFRHALLRDAAYGALLPESQRALHARIAEALEGDFATLAESEPELVARHLDAAGRPERAAQWWHRAGERAIERSAHAEAIGHLQDGLRALAATPASDTAVTLEVGVLNALGQALLVAGGPTPECEAAYRQARSLGKAAGIRAGRFRATWGVWCCLSNRGEHDRAATMVGELFECLPAADDPLFELQARHAAWSTGWLQGDIATAARHAEAGHALYRLERHHASTVHYGNHDSGTCARGTLGVTRTLMGCPEEGAQHVAAGVALARRTGHANTLAVAIGAACTAAALRQDIPATRALALDLQAFCVECGIPSYRQQAEVLLGWCAARAGDGAAGIAAMQRSLTGLEAMRARVRHTMYLGLLADCSLTAGDDETAAAALAKARQLAAETGEHFYRAELSRLQAVLALVRSADRMPEAQRHLETAMATARAHSAGLFELRSAAALASLHAENGRLDAAAQVLRPVLERVESACDSAERRQAMQLLRQVEGG
jgi:DNA-binding winged helix-turn-helix (wHTH) protein